MKKRFNSPLQRLFVGALVALLCGCSTTKNEKINYRQIDKEAYQLFRNIRALEREGRTAEAFDAANMLIADYPKSNYTDDAILVQAKYYLSDSYEPFFSWSDKYYLAYEKLQGLVEKFPASRLIPQAAKLQCEIGDYYFETKGDFRQAIDIYDQALLNYPYLKEGRQAQRRVADFYYNLAETAWVPLQEYYEKAASSYRNYIRRYLKNASDEETSFRLARTIFKSRNKYAYDSKLTAEAVDMLAKHLHKYPETAHRADATKFLAQGQAELAEKLFKAAEIYHTRLDSNAGAIRYYGRVVDEYPHTIFAELALLETAVLYEQEDNLTNAMESCRRLIADYPAGEHLDRAQKLLSGWREQVRQ